MKIDGWSFIPNPEVFSILQRGRDPLVRYILFIETLRAKYYFLIRDFLRAQKVNVNSYYTGGSADFICDVNATESAYKTFHRELKQTLLTAGVGNIKDVESLIAVFRVEKPVILSRQVIATLPEINPRGVKLIEDDVARFELVYRNYLSPEVKRAFPGNRLSRYLAELKTSGAIIGFRALFDNCRLTDREYVPLCHGRALDKLLVRPGEAAQAVLKPVRELLSVLVEHSTDPTEREVTHIFINEYDSPGERNDWRVAVYKQLGDDLNVFTFPLEGTLNETPIVFSDLPEAITTARQYKGDIAIGRLSHDSDPQNASPIFIQSQALASSQGITLGKPNRGKTNTDCVLLTGVSQHFGRIIVIDHSRSIRGKEAVFSEDLRKRIKYVSPTKHASPLEIASLIGKCVEEHVYVLEVTAEQAPVLFDACLTEIANSTVNEDNTPRVVSNFLLVEEANDVLGRDEERKRIVGRLQGILTKASRYGWCIWLSTQKPSHLGYDHESSVTTLRALRFRILHDLEPEDTALLKAAIGNGPLGKSVDETISLPTGEAIVFGLYHADDKIVALPPVRVRVNMLGNDAIS